MPTNAWGTYRTLIRKTVSDRETHPGLKMSMEIRQRTGDGAFDVVLNTTKPRAKINSRNTNLSQAITIAFSNAYSQPKNFLSQFTYILEHEGREFLAGWTESQKS